MPLLTSLAATAKALEDKLTANKDALGLLGVYYGDQNKISTTPVACVEPDFKANELKAARRMLNVTMTIYIIVYHSQVRSPQLNRYEADAMTEAIETLIHLDPRLLDAGGQPQLIHSYVTEVNSGYARRDNAIYKASRLTFSGLTQNQLPS